MPRTHASLSRWETGKVEQSLQGLRIIASIYGVATDDLLRAPPSTTEANDQDKKARDDWSDHAPAQTILKVKASNPKWRVYDDPADAFDLKVAGFLTDSAVAEAFDASRFVFARTMPKWPHFYIVREKYQGTIPWENLVQHIRDRGRVGYFQGKRSAARMYWCHAGWRYWTMGYELNVTTVINRDEDVSVDYLEFEEVPERLTRSPPRQSKSEAAISEGASRWRDFAELHLQNRTRSETRWAGNHLKSIISNRSVWISSCSSVSQNLVYVQLVAKPSVSILANMSEAVAIELLHRLPDGSQIRPNHKNSVWFEKSRPWKSFSTDQQRGAWLAETLMAFDSVFYKFLIQ